MTSDTKTDPERCEYIEHRVAHCRQRYSWDCGVTCVMMLLSPEPRRQLLQDFDHVCREEGFGHSTWTIDLAYLLMRFGVKHRMYTTMMGVNEDYRRHDYYHKIIDLDRARVQRRFAEASSRGLSVTQRAVGADELARHVAAHGPAIVLVDAARLSCDRCKRNKLRSELTRWFGGGYSGHYVLVVGLSRGRLLYRDPARSPRVCRAGPAGMHGARAASGTDHDVLLVYTGKNSY